MIETYHGTSVRYLDNILMNGILPREITKNSNYDGHIQSKNLVYLSKGYPVFYGQNALQDSEDRIVVFKVAIDENFSYPDEDFLTYAFKGIDLYEPKDYKHLASQCLDLSGNCCVDVVLPTQLLSYRVIPKNLELLLGADTNPMATCISKLRLHLQYETQLDMYFEFGIEGLVDYLEKNDRRTIMMKESLPTEYAKYKKYLLGQS